MTIKVRNIFSNFYFNFSCIFQDCKIVHVRQILRLLQFLLCYLYAAFTLCPPKTLENFYVKYHTETMA